MEQDQAFRAHIADLCRMAARRGVARFSDYLDEAAQEQAALLVRREGLCYRFFGGYEGAARCVLGVSPDSESPSPDAFPVVALRAAIPKGFSLTHRDFLGAMLALGIKRGSVGDILIDGDSAHLFLLPAARDLVLTELRQVGRVGVQLFEGQAEGLRVTQRFEESEAAVASLRLDCVVAVFCRCAREEAARRITAGLVRVAGREVLKPDKQLSGGEAVSVRGEGKFVLETTGRTTRKGRVCVCIRRYV